METMLASMSQDELDQWTHSFQKMKAGDMTVLGRFTPVQTSGRHTGLLAPGPARCVSEDSNLVDATDTSVSGPTAVKREVRMEQTCEESPQQDPEATTGVAAASSSASSWRKAAPQSHGSTVLLKVGSHRFYRAYC